MAVVWWWLPWAATVVLAATAAAVFVWAARQPERKEEEVTPAETSLASSSRSPMEVAAEEIARATARAQELRLSRWAGREVGGNTAGRAAPYTGRRTVGIAGKRRKGSGGKPAGTGRMSGR